MYYWANRTGLQMITFVHVPKLHIMKHRRALLAAAERENDSQANGLRCCVSSIDRPRQQTPLVSSQVHYLFISQATSTRAKLRRLLGATKTSGK